MPERGERRQAEQVGRKVEPVIEKDTQRSATDGKDDLKSVEPLSPSTDASSRSRELDAAESHPKQPLEPVKEAASKPLETFLTMEPAGASAEEHKSPHLHAPPYVHHFDTYTLVRGLEKGNFTMDQSVTLMKAVRSLLALNLDIAREELESKSDIENETYLFRAACSELRIEISNTRKVSTEKMRSERAQLQHEVDILNQKLTQDLLTLKDDLKGLFDDRKMAVRMEQRTMEGRIQELNYKITVALNSDSKSEVEGLRWVLTRRAAMAIVCMAFLILGSLRYSSYRLHAQEQERKRQASSSGSTSSSSSGGDRHTVPSREMGTQTEESDAMLAGINSGASPSYVSLG
ncbi:Protein of unknown function DUF1640 [Lasallia pustulata]|nr:Protein of unknown function DUF1640 [Lasallia pustulata]